jgi:hypothetical protein
VGVERTTYLLSPCTRRRCNPHGQAKRYRIGTVRNSTIFQTVWLFVLGFWKMQTCPACGHNVEAPPRDLSEPFLCGNCKNALRVTLRFRTLFLAAFAIVTVSWRMFTLALNPRVNATKASRMPFAMESALARVLWRTKLVRVELDHSPVPAAIGQSG